MKHSVGVNLILVRTPMLLQLTLPQLSETVANLENQMTEVKSEIEELKKKVYQNLIRILKRSRKYALLTIREYFTLRKAQKTLLTLKMI